jgi:hypothetical protein
MAGRQRRKFADKIEPLDHHDGRCSARANCVQPVTKSISLGRVRGTRLPRGVPARGRYGSNIRCRNPNRRRYA